MRFQTIIGFFVAAAALLSQPAHGQDATKQAAGNPAASATVPEGGMPRYIRPETPEQRMARLGTKEDPGINPDSKVKWYRNGTVFTIEKVDRQWVKPAADPGYVKTYSFNIGDEIYQENDRYVWIWVPAPPPRRTPEERRAAIDNKDYSEDAVEYMRRIRPEYEPLDPPPSTTRVRFEESSKGLPEGGSWRNSLAVGDMNGDGHSDLVVPSERGAASGTPAIYLGDGKGNWKVWSKVQWPYRLDYGGVAVADFNKDKKMDVAFAIHLEGVVVLFGNGKGKFVEARRERKFPSRRIVATDVDADGWMDVVAIWEGPLARGKELRGPGYGGLRAYLNRDKGARWEGVNLSEPKYGISGDWLAAGNFNGDSRPDFIGSTMFSNSTHTLYMSASGGAENAKVEPYDDTTGLVIPGRGTYQAVTAGRFSGHNTDDAIVASVRSWPTNLDPKLVARPPLQRVVALDRLTFTGGVASRHTILRFDGGNQILGLGHGDFDRDGKEDLLFSRFDPREGVLLLGDGKGGFRRAEVEGLKLPLQKNYDLTIADVNGDARPDVVVMYETDSTATKTKNGRIQVFLNRGPVK